MDPIFTEEQLNRMSRRICSLVKMMQIIIRNRKNKDPAPGRETANWNSECDAPGPMYSLAQKKMVWCFSEKYMDGYT